MPLHRYLLSPLRELSETGRLSGMLLLLATLVSLALSNFGPGLAYVEFWDTKLGPAFFRKASCTGSTTA